MPSKSPVHKKALSKVKVPKPLHRASKQSLRRTSRQIFGTSILPLTSSGTPGPIDANLSAEPQLTKAALTASAGSLKVQWADIYFGELKLSLPELLRLRNEYAAQNAKYINDTLTLEEMVRSEDIRDQEVAAGSLTLSRDLAASELSAQEKWAASAAKAIKAFDDIPAYKNIGTLVSYRAWLAQASMAPAFYKVLKEVLDNPAAIMASENLSWAQDPILGAGKFDVRPPPDPTQVTHNVSLINGVKVVTGELASVELGNAVSQIESQEALANGTNDSAIETLVARQRAFDWSKANADFLRQRKELSQLMRDLRKAAVTADDGPLNALPLLKGSRARFVTLLADMVAKAQVCADGLRVSWDYQTPALPMPYSWRDADGSYIEALAAWFSEVQRIISSALPSEKSAVIALSIRDLVTPQVWSAAILNARNGHELTLSFHVKPVLLAGMRAARLRGISVFVSGVADTIAGVWRGRIIPPIFALVCDAGGATLSRVQQDAPETDVGRVMTRVSPRTPDIVGSAQLRNISPIGNDAQANYQWTVSLSPKSSEEAYAADLSNVQIDLFVAFST
ncbi:MAG: hypothetical protein ABIZ04_17805 [Opitutus sp.]